MKLSRKIWVTMSIPRNHQDHLSVSPYLATSQTCVYGITYSWMETTFLILWCEAFIYFPSQMMQQIDRHRPKMHDLTTPRNLMCGARRVWWNIFTYSIQRKTNWEHILWDIIWIPSLIAQSVHPYNPYIIFFCMWNDNDLSNKSTRYSTITNSRLLVMSYDIKMIYDDGHLSVCTWGGGGGGGL